MGTAAPQRLQHFISIIMINAFDSSALESVAIDDGQVLVTFNGGRTYTYTVADVERFVTAFNTAESKGRFLNQQIKEETLERVTV
ncbi:MAG: hypothetical protein CMD02_05015 [Flavobacteriales bacterium]|nr:hypothetical protein [Flavobacteriales bacterium]